MLTTLTNALASVLITAGLALMAAMTFWSLRPEKPAPDLVELAQPERLSAADLETAA